MAYDGYIGVVEYDESADIFRGRVINIPDVIRFEGRSIDELHQALRDSVEGYRAMCAEEGVEPQKPFSGKLVVRLDPELHRAVSIAAGRGGVSLNTFITQAVRERIQHLAPAAKREGRVSPERSRSERVSHSGRPR